MVRAHQVRLFNGEEAWDLPAWSIDDLLAALTAGDRQQRRAAAMELLKRKDARAAVPLVRWALARDEREREREDWITGLLGTWILSLSDGVEKAEALSLVARLPDVGMQKTLLRAYHRKRAFTR